MPGADADAATPKAKVVPPTVSGNVSGRNSTDRDCDGPGWASGTGSVSAAGTGLVPGACAPASGIVSGVVWCAAGSDPGAALWPVNSGDSSPAKAMPPEAGRPSVLRPGTSH